MKLKVSKKNFLTVSIFSLIIFVIKEIDIYMYNISIKNNFSQDIYNQVFQDYKYLENLLFSIALSLILHFILNSIAKIFKK